MRARQTGYTPTAPQRLEPTSGLPTREPLSPPITGAQAQRRYGTSYGTSKRGLVAMGQRERSSEALRRALVIRDAEHHGHLPSAYQTRIKIEREGKAESDKLYANLRQVGKGYDPGSEHSENRRSGEGRDQ